MKTNKRYTLNELSALTDLTMPAPSASTIVLYKNSDPPGVLRDVSCLCRKDREEEGASDEGVGAGEDVDAGYILVNINKLEWCRLVIVDLL